MTRQVSRQFVEAVEPGGAKSGRATLHLKAFRLVPPPSRVASAEAVIGTPVQRDKAVLEADDGWDIVAENLA